MSIFTRDWLSSWILDHSKFKTQPSYVRGLMDDVGERLAAYLYGFSTGETFTGFKMLRLITIGTGSGTIPSGTGVQGAIHLQGKTIGGKTELIVIDADGNEIQFTSKGTFLANNAWLQANGVGTGANINILKINTANQIEIGTSFGTHLVGPDTGPVSDLQYAPKGYVDKELTAAVANIPDGVTLEINTGTNQMQIKNATSKVSGLFGSWESKSHNTVYQAATDGIVICCPSNGGGTNWVYSDSSNPPTTIRALNTYGFAISPVKKGDYYKGYWDSGTAAVYWIPLGS